MGVEENQYGQNNTVTNIHVIAFRGAPDEPRLRGLAPQGAEAIDLITAQGFHRDRDLLAALEDALR